ncbi:hypothetical protein E3W66_03880 [Gammaproteobacteria bacterium LSUCC0057]|uniref:Uncharacterized protein n=1 Tax=Gammaproteobacteria bacterium LSUCC0057 TaxID=2559237 RepID=A0A4Y8UP89_9GAMM|nr:hypothetical protein E3W66_03880 [Gammaproteobacteria bacterium LSUCC0057]
MSELFAGYTTAWALYALGLVLLLAAQLWLLRGWSLAVSCALALSLAVLLGWPIEAYPGEPALAPALWVALFEGLLGGGSFARAGAPLATVWVGSQSLYWPLMLLLWLLRKLLWRRS